MQTGLSSTMALGSVTLFPYSKEKLTHVTSALEPRGFKKLNDLERKGLHETIKELTKQYEMDRNPITYVKIVKCKLRELESCLQYSKEEVETEKTKNKKAHVDLLSKDKQLKKVETEFNHCVTLKRKRDEEYHHLQTECERKQKELQVLETVHRDLKANLECKTRSQEEAEKNLSYWKPLAIDFGRSFNAEKAVREKLEKELNDKAMELAQQKKLKQEQNSLLRQASDKNKELEKQLVALKKEKATQEASLNDEKAKRQKVEEKNCDLNKALEEKNSTLNRQTACLTTIQMALTECGGRALLPLNDSSPLPLSNESELEPLIPFPFKLEIAPSICPASLDFV